MTLKTLLINGKIPSSLEEVEAFQKSHENEIPTNFEIGDTWDYEENMEWDSCVFTWSNGDTLEWGAYWGVWELRSFDWLKDEHQKNIIQWMFEYINHYWDDFQEIINEE